MNIFYTIIILVSLSGCYSLKKVNYLQSKEDEFQKLTQPQTYFVQSNDIISVTVQSRDPEQAAFFNISGDGSNIQANEASLFLSGYSVNQEGIINLPIIGEMKVSGLSIEQIQDLVQKEIDKYLLDAIVLVKLTSFKVSVLGDVANPGTSFVYNDQATIFEALSAAGDANLSANRQKVRLIRKMENESIVVTLDLTDPNVMESPYYFLLPNDVIFVETSKQNIIRNNLVLTTVLLAAISTSLLIVSFVQNQNSN